MHRYVPSRKYFHAALAALVVTVVSGWFAYQWIPSIVPAVLMLATSALLFFLSFRPPVEIHPHHLRIGNRAIPWPDIRAIDRTGWISPLVLFLTLDDDSREVLIYPGDLDTSRRLLNHICRSARESLIDGVPHPEFWGETSIDAGPPEDASIEGKTPRYPMLREEDEAEVERLYQKLKVVGHLDPKDEN